jgi:phenylpyruvate tautomerase PptA (4-oxalocrotonate tautomerase family)
MIKLHASCDIPSELHEELSSIVAETIGKPEEYVMVVVTKADVLMSGTRDAAVYAEVKSIGGLNRIVNHEITMKVCDLLNDHLGISMDRIYVTFTDVPADHWGWNGATFG